MMRYPLIRAVAALFDHPRKQTQGESLTTPREAIRFRA